MLNRLSNRCVSSDNHKRGVIIFLSLGLLLFSSCNNTSPVTPGGDPSIKVTSISLDKEECYIKINKTYGFIVNYVPSEGLDDDDKAVTWSSDNPEIVSISQYGVARGLLKGDATISATTVKGNISASCLVHVYETSTTEYQKIDDVESLTVGDVVVIACPQKNVTAGLDDTGRRLAGVSSTFTSDYSKITTLNDDTAELVLGNEVDRFTLESQEDKYLMATNDKKIGWVNGTDANVYWTFEKTGGKNYLYSTVASIDGWMMYNAHSDINAFSLYDSSEQVDMFNATFYKKVTIYN